MTRKAQSRLVDVWKTVCLRRRLELGAFLLALFAGACSIPNLELPDCTAARGTTANFYSFHFGNDMIFSRETLDARRRFLTPDYYQRALSQSAAGDIFTTGDDDLPKAFRVGACEVIEPGKARVEVLLFWRDNQRSEQRQIFANVVKQGDKWLIDDVVRERTK